MKIAFYVFRRHRNMAKNIFFTNCHCSFIHYFVYILSIYQLAESRTVLGRSRQSKKGEKVKQLKFALRLEREMEESRFVQLESIATE